MDTKAVLINEQDNVAVAIRAIKAGETITGVAGVKVKATADVMKNHKVAIKAVAAGEPIVKYGESIGLASKDVNPGDWVHTHNLKADQEVE